MSTASAELKLERSCPFDAVCEHISQAGVSLDEALSLVLEMVRCLTL